MIWDDDLATWNSSNLVEVVSGGLYAEFGDNVPLNADNLIYKLIQQELLKLEISLDFRLICYNNIPHSKGLGSSSVAIVLAMRAALQIQAYLQSGSCLVEEENAKVFQRALEIEGHPDNIAPCIFSGVQLAQTDGLEVTKITLGGQLHIELLLNSTQGLPTHNARRVLPQTVPFTDAVNNSRNFANLILGLKDGDNLRLFDGTADLLHQQYRRELYFESMELIAKGRENGIPMAISGAGTTVIALWFEDDVKDNSYIDRFNQVFSVLPSNWIRYSTTLVN